MSEDQPIGGVEKRIGKMLRGEGTYRQPTPHPVGRTALDNARQQRQKTRPLKTPGQQFKQRIQVGTHEEMCQLIEQDIGIGVLPSIVVERCGHRVKAIDIEDAWSVQPLKVCALDPEHLPDYGRGLIEFLVAHAEAGGLRSG